MDTTPFALGITGAFRSGPPEKLTNGPDRNGRMKRDLRNVKVNFRKSRMQGVAL